MPSMKISTALTKVASELPQAPDAEAAVSGVTDVVAPAPVDQPVTQEDVEQKVTPTAVPEESPAQPTGARKSARPKRTNSKPTAPAKPVAGGEGSKGVAVELPVDIDRRLAAYRKTSRKSHPTILLEAVERTYEQLPGLIRKALGRDEEAPRTVLFDRGPRIAAPIRLDEDGGEKVRHTIRIAEAHRELLDELTDQFEAPSRNFLIVTAYDAFLPQE